MTKRQIFWVGMTVLAFGVASYATAIVWIPGFRQPLVRALFAERPFATYGHFFGGAIALVTGAMQVNSGLRFRFINLHRWLGRLYVLAVMMGGTAGLNMALFSTGGTVAHVGFGLLAVFWLATTFLAYRYIRQGNLPVHRNWMIRSYALTLAAVTLRLYLPASQIAGISFTEAYPVIAWISWVPNLLIAEWFIRSRHLFAPLPASSPVDL